jgi:sulfate permease, SulP family
MHATPTARIGAGRGTLGADLWGGAASMLVALPSAIAFGITVYALIGPESLARGANAGIIGAIALGLIAPVLGGAPRLISAPCAPAAAVLAAFATELLAPAGGAAGSGTERIIVLLMLVGFLAGVLQLAYGALGFGRLIKYIPYPVVSGYLSAVAVLIFVSQVPKFLGLPNELATWGGVWSPPAWRLAALVVGGATVLGFVVTRHLTKAVPGTIVGLAAGLAAYWVYGAFDPTLRSLEHNPFVIGSVAGSGNGVAAALGASLSALIQLSWSDVKLVVVPALTLSLLLSADTLKTCVVLDALTLSRHNANRELLGQGAANVVSGLFGGMPGAGTMGATLINHASGGRTRLSGICEGGFVLAAALLLRPWLAWLPIPALAGLLLVVAFRMIDWHNFDLLRQRSTLLDFLVIAAVVAVAVKFNLIAAAGAGLALAILLFIRDQVRGSVIRRKITADKFSSKQHRVAADQAVLESAGRAITICELQGSLFFGTTDQLLCELEPDLQHARYLILDWRRVRSVDYTAVHLLERFEARLKQRDGCLLFSRLPPAVSQGRDLRRYFEQVGVLKKDVLVFDTLDDALQWAEDRVLAAARPEPREGDEPLGLADFDLTRPLTDPATTAVLGHCVDERSFAAGEHIFRAGEHSDRLYLIRRGVVRIVLPLNQGGHHNLASFGRGSFFGEMAFLDSGVRSADAVATEPTSLFVISRSVFDAVSARQPEVASRILAELARELAVRLRRSDAEIRALYEA